MTRVGGNKYLAGKCDYQKAREKLRASLTCNTSELQTDDEQEVVVARKRKIKPRLIFGDTDSESEPEERNNTRPTYHSLTPAPTIPPPTPNFSARPLPDPNHAEHLHFTAPTIPPPTPNFSARPLPDSNHSEHLHFTAAAPLAPVPPPFIPSSPPCQISAGPLPDLRQCDRGSYTGPVALVPTPTSRIPSSPRRRITATPLTNDYQGHCFVPTFRLGRTGTAPVPCSAAELHILTLLEHIKEQQMQLAAAVNNIAARMGTETPIAEMPQNISVPLATMSEVEELEEWLKDARNSHAKQNMISALGAVGGQNSKRVTWNVLSRIFSNTVAKQINWKGVNGKRSFKEMLTQTLLIKAVRKNQVASSASDNEINQHAIRWFNLASDRGGGRKERAMARDALTME
ncbi:uncharacterized protein LOC120461499 [Pimephales promelas]|uniref:uncharacterized protein LOC120461499 n=1 Tax=Pimephales promelas TaxID=90988 RepID=UPI001955CB55|nr:uncharacterized protein LOC120461499 [Pimephales promelas]